jgi:hypothetical protein
VYFRVDCYFAGSLTRPSGGPGFRTLNPRRGLGSHGRAMSSMSAPVRCHARMK